MKTTVYKIRNKTTGEFSKGGSSSVWSKVGKVWSNIGHIKNHLNYFISRGRLDVHYPYHDAEIIEIVIDYDNCFKTDLDEFANALLISKAQADDDYIAREAKWKEDKERQLFEELKKKFENE